jgi:hypothetical protein
MSMDFPSSPSVGQTYSVSGGPTYTFTGVAWRVLTPGNQFARTAFTATAGQTVFSVNYQVGAVDVFQNGVKLVSGSDFTATNGTSITLLNAATVGDTIEVVSYSQVVYSNAASTSDVYSVIRGMKNRLMNGAIAIDQRNAGASQTITAGAALAYTVDRWYAYCTGANVTGQRVQGASANRYRYQFTGAASVTGIGFGQRLEAINTADLAGTIATLSVELANSVLTTVNWAAYYASTTDTFGTLASPTRTQIATGSFTVTSTPSRYSTQISIPSAATTGIEIVFSVGAQTSGTWTIGEAQLEAGTVTNPVFERRSYQQELAMCQRYYEALNANLLSGTGPGNNYICWFFKATKRSTPTITATISGTIYATTVDFFEIYFNSSNAQINSGATASAEL